MYSPGLFEKMSHHKSSLIILIVEHFVQDKPKKNKYEDFNDEVYKYMNHQ